MSTYRTGNHHGVTIVREGDGSRCGRPDHDCDRGHLAAVVVDGGQELAERICTLLNGGGGPCPAEFDSGMPEPYLRRCELLAGHAGDHKDGGMRWWEIPEDSCTCPLPLAADPACPVHHGRKARGPHPPPVGPGCICDGSGRTCPRHGAVIRIAEAFGYDLALVPREERT